MTALLGIIMMYSWVHLIVIVFQRAYTKSTGYEKVVTIVAIVSFALYVLGTL